MLSLTLNLSYSFIFKKFVFCHVNGIACVIFLFYLAKIIAEQYMVPSAQKTATVDDVNAVIPLLRRSITYNRCKIHINVERCGGYIF